MDGRLDDPARTGAAWIEEFVDIEGDLKPRPRFRTRAKMLWDDDYLERMQAPRSAPYWGRL